MGEENNKDRILIIDDEPNIANLISDFCDELGFTVKAVNDSSKAFDTIREFKPDLITLDLQMPKVDGFELLNQLKADPDTRHIPVIIVSILAGEAERQGLLSAAQAILGKPINLGKLRDKVTEYVHEKKEE